jgi:hypothetical protein
VLPLRDLNPTRIQPVVTLGLIAVSLAVWIAYELPTGVEAAVAELGYQPCELDGSCDRTGSGPAVTILTSMFMHGSWAHVLGNMLFLWIFGNNIEDALGHVRFLAFYVLGGVAAALAQSFVTLRFGEPLDGVIPMVGASGAVAAVLGAYILLYPRALVLTWIAPFFLVPIPALAYLAIWFVFQLVEGTASMTAPEPGGGVAYFAHIGGFGFGFVALRLFMAGRRPPARYA